MLTSLCLIKAYLFKTDSFINTSIHHSFIHSVTRHEDKTATMTKSPQEEEEAVQSCLDILQSTNPADSEKNFLGLQSFLSSSEEKQIFKQQVPTLPFKVQQDPNAKNRPFILSNYNCVRVSATQQTLLPNDNDDEESTISYYRSPWSNIYYPSSSSSTKVQQRQGESGDTLKRQVELQANEVWDAYKNMYYGKSDNATGSVYIWDSNHPSKQNEETLPPQFQASDWSGAFLIHKSLGTAEWNSHHVVHVSTSKNSTATYHIQSTVTLHLTTEQQQQPQQQQKEGESFPNNNSTTSNTKISGSTKKTTTQQKFIPPHASSPTYLISKHLETVGSMIEDVEIDLRSNMDILGIQKTKQVVEQLRPPLDAAEYYAYRPPKSSHSSSNHGNTGSGRRGPPPGGVPMFPGMGGGIPLPGMGGRRGTSAQQDEHSIALQQAVLAQAMKKKSSIS